MGSYHRIEGSIETKAINEFTMFCNTLMNTKLPMIGFVYGPPGIGKTASADTYYDNLPDNKINGLKHTLKVSTNQKPTNLSEVTQLYTAVGEITTRNRYSNVLLHELYDLLIGNLIKLIIIDEADRLRNDVFEMYRDIYDHKDLGISLVFIGLPKLISSAKKVEQFYDRVGPKREFNRPDQDEFIYGIMPKLNFDRLIFSPDKESDIKLAKYVYRLSRGNFRNVMDLLNLASTVAGEFELKKINKECVDYANVTLSENNSNKKGGEKKK